MPWTMSEKVRLVELFHETGSALLARRRFMREGNRRRGPNVKTISGLVEKFRATGSVTSRTGARGASRNTLSAVKLIRRVISRNPKLSVRRLARRAKVPPTTVQRILRQWLKLHPYRLQRVHQLKRGDKAKRVRLCSWLARRLRSPKFSKHFFMRDEAHFYLDGGVTKRNCRIWGTENPHETVDHDPYAPHVTVWCAISPSAVIGPYFFLHRGKTVTVTATRYKNMLEKFFVPELQRRGIPLSKVWFQQDGAKPHTAHGVLKYLSEVFGARVLSKNTSVEWPPRSPDLTAPDFFLWGWLKMEVYRNTPTSLKALKQRLRTLINGISAPTLRALRDAMVARCHACLRQRGGPIEHLPLH